MKILMVGAGYVGLTSATVFANYHQVTVVDINEDKIDQIKLGQNVISEPDLCLNQKKLSFSTSIKKVMKEDSFDLIFICVGTPLVGQTGFTDQDQSYDLSMLEQAIEDIVRHNKKKQDLNLVIKSTVLPGTAKMMKEKAQSYAKECKLNCHIEIVSSPAFLREGYAVYDVRYPSRVVIGLNKKSRVYDKLKKKIEDFYKTCDISPLIFVDNDTAELSKLSANAFLASKVSFMNEQMVLAQKSGAKIDDIVKILEADCRIGKYINPGIGYGGYCLPKDVVALKTYAKEQKIQSCMLESIHDTNMKQMKLIINKIENFVLESSTDLIVGIYGIAFKNITRNSKDSPAIYIAEQLKNRNINVVLIDDNLTLEQYKNNEKKGKKDIHVDVALIANKQGYDLFKYNDKLKLVIDPLRLIEKNERNKMKVQKIQYCII